MQQQSKLRIIITGSSGGVGTALATRNISAGNIVLGIDKVPNRSLHGQEEKWLFERCDLTTRLGLDRTIVTAEQAFDGVDILVHTAGVFFSDADINARPEKLQEMWNSNFFTAVELTNRLLPLLTRGNFPLVVFISSADAIVASAGQECEVGVTHDIHYATTKGALITLTRALALKLAKYRIRVNTICPTIIRTQMCKELLALPGKEAELCQHIPLGRLSEPDDVAVAVECLYSLRMTTAHILPVDGGYLCQ